MKVQIGKFGTRKAVVIIILASLMLFYFLVDPASTGLVPKCPFLMMTGYECPGCGSQRMLHALLHGDLGRAWHYNSLLMLMLPWIVLLLASEVYREKCETLYRLVNHPVCVALFCVAIVVWFFVRNFVIT